MDVVYARQILKRPTASAASGELKNGVFKGMKLVVEKVGENRDLGIASDIDRLWIAIPFDDIVTKMTPDEVAQMGRWGWFHDDGVWCRRT